ncbi:hypothetical protein H4R19_003774 [Coemansia spiralis]|nr:hypothetical protein H4R19_003774 [Coemansia spiralis]
MVKISASLVLGALFGALVGAQPVALEARNYEVINPAPVPPPRVIYVTKTVTVTVPGAQPTSKPDYVAVPPKQVPAPAPQPAAAQPGSWQQQMLDQVNTVRRQAGKAPVKIDPRLQQIAQAHSQEQNAKQAMVHTSSYGTLGQRYQNVGINWRAAAENIAWNQKTCDQVMNSWKNSPGHYANMIGNYNYVGFGMSNYYWTQDFVLTA